MPRNTLAQAAAEIARRLEQLARVSDERGATTRTFLSPAMRRANALVGGWMRGAGLTVREDGAGNLIGRAPGPSAASRTLLMGSHLDTVRDAGRFDGALGVLLPIAALEAVRGRGLALPFAVEVLGFSEEEGVRFSSAYLGSKAYTGRLRKSDLRLRDPDGVSVGEALTRRNGRWRPLPKPAHSRGELLGYLEVHIEQGPVLESRGLAAGVVPAIAGQTRAIVSFTGRAGHAGTTPMALRRDALAGAAEFILEAEARARGRPPLVATVGRIAAHPGAPNVIAGAAELSLDVRHPSDAARLAALGGLRRAGLAIARRRGLAFACEVTQDNPAVSCSAGLTALLEESVRACQGRSLRVPSGAGHDAVILSALAPVAMLFVRCRKGLSHHPDEFVRTGDIAVALEIVVEFLARLASGRPR
jgi:allantoate deiminase